MFASAVKKQKNAYLLEWSPPRAKTKRSSWIPLLLLLKTTPCVLVERVVDVVQNTVLVHLFFAQLKLEATALNQNLASLSQRPKEEAFFCSSASLN